MLYGIETFQDKGKSATAVGIAKWLIQNAGYKSSDVIANMRIRWPGATTLHNNALRTEIIRMLKERIKHKIVIIDEADRVFPARFWRNADQSDALIGLWQDEKMFLQVIYTQHVTRSSDKLLLGATQIEIVPNYVKEHDTIYLTIINKVDGKIYWQNGELVSIPRISHDALIDVSKNIFPDYDRWEDIV